MMLARWAAAGLILAAAASARVRAQGARPALSPAVKDVAAIDTNIVALTHVRVIDGTGAPARADQTVIVRDGRIEQIGAAAAVAVPSGARVLDLTGKSVIPGLVMVHEHLFYPTGPGVYGNVAESFVRLYLAGGVTSMRTQIGARFPPELRIKLDQLIPGEVRRLEDARQAPGQSTHQEERKRRE